MSKLDPPTLPAFGVLIDAHLHSKATAGQAASANRTEGKNQQQQKNKTNPKITDTENKRRQVMKGICFRCGSSEHMANNCKVAKDVKCCSCNTPGHIQRECLQGKASSAEQTTPQVGSDTLALGYQQPQTVEYPSAQVNVIRNVQQGNNSWPTPPMLL